MHPQLGGEPPMPMGHHMGGRDHNEDRMDLEDDDSNDYRRERDRDRGRDRDRSRDRHRSRDRSRSRSPKRRRRSRSRSRSRDRRRRSRSRDRHRRSRWALCAILVDQCLINASSCLFMTANMSPRTCVVVKQMQSNPSCLFDGILSISSKCLCILYLFGEYLPSLSFQYFSHRIINVSEKNYENCTFRSRDRERDRGNRERDRERRKQGLPRMRDGMLSGESEAIVVMMTVYELKIRRL